MDSIIGIGGMEEAWRLNRGAWSGKGGVVGARLMGAVRSARGQLE